MCNHYLTSHFPWFHPGWQHSPTQPLTRPLIQWDGERVRKVKLQKFMGWDTDKLIGKKMGWGEKNTTKHIKEVKNKTKKPRWCKRKPFLTSQCLAHAWHYYSESSNTPEKPNRKKKKGKNPPHLFSWCMRLVISSSLMASSIKQMEVKPECPFLKSWFEVGKEKPTHRVLLLVKIKHLSITAEPPAPHAQDWSHSCL